MKKYIALLLSLLFIVVAFTGCKKDRIYVDPAGHTYIAVTDENNNTVLNDEGNIVVYQTDENGEIATNNSGVPETLASVFPDQIADGKMIQTPTYTLTLPSGWKSDEIRTGIFNKKSADASMKIEIVLDYTLQDYYNHSLEVFNKYKESEEDSSLKIEEDSFNYLAANADVYRFTITKNDENGVPNKMVILIFENGGNVYKITCQSSEANYEKANFSELYSVINYKNIQYK